jgi:hypothetical protein
MRPVTHDWFRSTVAGANDVSRLRRGVALKTARTNRKTLKRDSPEAGCLRKQWRARLVNAEGNQNRREATRS